MKKPYLNEEERSWYRCYPGLTSQSLITNLMLAVMVRDIVKWFKQKRCNHLSVKIVKSGHGKGFHVFMRCKDCFKKI